MTDTEELDDEVEDDEDECEKLTELYKSENKKMINLFYNDLTLKNLSHQTVLDHVTNVQYFLNYMVSYYDTPWNEAIYDVEKYLGNLFIRKCMWSTPKTIKTTATSIKKFYKCMLDNEKIIESEYNLLCDEIKENLTLWQEKCRKYNTPGEENPFTFFDTFF